MASLMFFTLFLTIYVLHFTSATSSTTPNPTLPFPFIFKYFLPLNSPKLPLTYKTTQPYLTTPVNTKYTNQIRFNPDGRYIKIRTQSGPCRCCHLHSILLPSDHHSSDFSFIAGTESIPPPLSHEFLFSATRTSNTIYSFYTRLLHNTVANKPIITTPIPPPTPSHPNLHMEGRGHLLPLKS